MVHILGSNRNLFKILIPTLCSRTRFLTVCTTGILDQIVHWGAACPAHRRMFSSIPRLSPLGASTWLSSYKGTKNISLYCQISPGGQNLLPPPMRTTNLSYDRQWLLSYWCRHSSGTHGTMEDYLKCIMLSGKKPDSKGCILCDSTCMTFWKRQNDRDESKITGFQGLSSNSERGW